MSSNFLQRLGQYFKERLPILPTLVFSLSYAGIAVGLNLEKTGLGEKIPLLFAFTTIFFLFLLRTRIVDEFKDASHDLQYYPDRPVPRGLIKKKELILMGLTTFITEMFVVTIIGLTRLLLYLPVVIYSFLMSREFFISRFLNRHFTLYFLTHEVIFVLFAFFFLLTIKPLFTWSTIDFSLSIIILTLYPGTVEILRKFKPRYDKKGKAVADSYSVVWGRNNTLGLIAILVLIVGLILSYLKANFLFLAMALIGMMLLVILSRKSDNLVFPITALTLMSFTVALNL